MAERSSAVVDAVPGSERLPYGGAARVLASAREVALACHINPDADALGSLLGLGLFLRDRGASVTASWGNEPFTPPRFLEALPGTELIVPPTNFPLAPAVMVTLDAASVDRLGALAGHLKTAGTVICVDHHFTNEGFGTVNLIEPHASSTAELVYRLIVEMGGPLTPDIAACLYAGIVTDTGRFQYSAATPETLRVAAELRAQGFDHARMAQFLFEDNSLAFLKVLAVALGRTEYVPEADLIWTSLTQADLSQVDIPVAETDDVIDVIRTAREADVAAVVKQQRDGTFKVSLRSRGGHDVGAIAAALGGGGHRLAAGYTSKHDVEGTVGELVAHLAPANG